MIVLKVIIIFCLRFICLCILQTYFNCITYMYTMDFCLKYTYLILSYIYDIFKMEQVYNIVQHNKITSDKIRYM